MADASRETSPPGWGDVFAALPLDTPPTSRWLAIEAALDAADHGDHFEDHREDRPAASDTWPRRAAWAAALALIALPALLWLRPATDVTSPRSSVATTPAIEPAAPTSALPERVAVAPIIDARAPAPHRTPASSSLSPQAVDPKGPRTRPTTARIAHAADPDAGPATTQSKPWPRARMTHGRENKASLQAAFEPYYMESARLERVIGATRDPRVGSGPAASLAGALDAELAAVDARLAQPGLHAEQRLALWQERVNVLRTSAELESQLRLLAAEGSALDAALVRVD